MFPGAANITIRLDHQYLSSETSEPVLGHLSGALTFFSRYLVLYDKVLHTNQVLCKSYHPG